jgi:hypothetical protein
MARAHVLAAMSALLFTLLILYQVATFVVVPESSFINLAWDSVARMNPGGKPLLYTNDALKKKQTDGAKYLLGVGKADITGYV